MIALFILCVIIMLAVDSVVKVFLAMLIQRGVKVERTARSLVADAVLNAFVVAAGVAVMVLELGGGQ